jgi:hypothetical protein
MDFKKIGITAGAGLALLLLGFAWGFSRGQDQVETIVQEKVVYKEGQTKVEYRDKIVTVTKVVKPDGTVTETTKTEDKAGTKESKSTKIAEDKRTDTRPVLPNYSIAGGVLSEFGPDILRPGYYLTGGYRLLGPAWIEAGGNTKRELTLGIRIEL